MAFLPPLKGLLVFPLNQLKEVGVLRVVHLATLGIL